MAIPDHGVELQKLSLGTRTQLTSPGLAYQHGTMISGDDHGALHPATAGITGISAKQPSHLATQDGDWLIPAKHCLAAEEARHHEMTGKCVLSAFILFAVLATTNSTENPCEGIIHEECINKETWCLVDANGRRGLSCRDAHCHPDEVDVDWNVCKNDGSELTCYKNPDGGQCICVCS
ncbi:hypothetical protein MRX96_042506 [Rhipicephalus microplus]